MLVFYFECFVLCEVFHCSCLVYSMFIFVVETGFAWFFGLCLVCIIMHLLLA